MKIEIRVTPNSKTAKVVRIDDHQLEVKVDERAKDGRANKRLIEILSEHYGVPKSSVVIIRGARSRDKVVEIIQE